MLFDARFVTQGLRGCDGKRVAQLLDVFFQGHFLPASSILREPLICEAPGGQARRPVPHATLSFSPFMPLTREKAQLMSASEIDRTLVRLAHEIL
jgi:hypothetical protein